jgi:D-3-phosphoglycerate dehydrogenase
MRVIITDAVDKACVDLLEAQDIQADVVLKKSKDELKAIISAYDGWIIRSGTKIDAELIEAGTNLKVIGRAGVGVDNVDRDAATRRGILVVNSPDGNTISTAEHTCAMMMALARHIARADQSLKGVKWERGTLNGTELYGKTLGVVGAGKIGRAVAERMKAFGMSIVAFDPLLNENVAERLGIKLVSLDELYAQSDFITVHTPLTEQTKNLLNTKTLAKCKKGVMLINCARGGIISEHDVLDALNSGQVGGLALDVYSSEPPTQELHALIQHPKVVSTPHIAASTTEAQLKVAEEVTAEVINALQGRPVNAAVNSFAIRMAAQSEVQPYLKLADRLGQVGGQLVDGTLTNITVKCLGDVSRRYSELLTIAVLRGILSRWHVNVNYINAPTLAKEKGFILEEQRGSERGGFSNLIEVSLETNQGKWTLGGAVFGQAEPRIVAINEYEFEVRPEGRILFYTNKDRPGMVAAVGGILAENNINIATFVLGRTEIGQMAMTAISVDQDVPKNVVKRIADLDGVQNVKLVSIS